MGPVRLALAWGQLDRFDEAQDAWRKLIQVEPLYGDYRLGLIQLLMREQKWQEAERQARAWIAVDPSLPAARAALRASLMQLGKFAEAEEQDRVFKELNRLQVGGR